MSAAAPTVPRAASAAAPVRRVMLLVDTLQVNGPSRLLVALAGGLRARGVDVQVAYLALGDWPYGVRELEARGIPVLDLGLRSLLDVRCAARLAAHLRRESVQLLHTHNRYAHLVGRIAAALAGCPVVSTDHWIVETDLGARGWIRCRLDDLTARLTRSELVMVCETQRREHARLGRLRGVPVHVIPNAIDAAAFRADAEVRRRTRARLGLDDSAAVFVTVAVLRPGKGHEYLLEAAARLRPRFPRARLIVVGDGGERARLARLTTSLRLDDVVRFVGTRTDVAALLAASDVYVHPSLFESRPTSVLEAMAAGLPVVATAVGGVPELIADGETGVLVPPANAPALAEAMARVLDAGTAARLGRNARAWVDAAGSHEAWIDAHEALYRRVTSAP